MTDRPKLMIATVAALTASFLANDRREYVPLRRVHKSSLNKNEQAKRKAKNKMARKSRKGNR